MAKASSALKKMREICLALPDTTEAAHFGETVFRVGKKIFASCGEKEGICRVVVQLEPEHARKLVESDPRYARYTRAKDCVVLNTSDIEDWNEVQSLVLESYRLNRREKPARKRAVSATKKKKK